MSFRVPSEHPHWQIAEERFRLLVESVKDYAILMLDPGGRIISWNEGARRINGYEADEIIGSHFSRFYPPHDVAAGKPERELAIAQAEGRVEDEGWRLRKDGTLFWADVVITALRDPDTNELRGYGKLTRDLTERKRADEELRHSEEQFRMLVESVSEYAIFMLDPSGRIATWNPGAQRLKGYAADEIIGQSFERFYTPEDRAAGRPAHLLEIARRDGSVRDVGVRVRKDGARFHADVLITAVHDHNGELRGFSKVTRDITDQIRNREMEAAKLAAEKANKAKDEFMAVLSHELRTPLTPVTAGLSYLIENADVLPLEERVQALKTVRRNVLLEAQLIDDLLDLTRISRGKIELRFESVNVHVALQEAVEICQEDIRAKGQSVALRLDALQHWAWADPIRIRQVFWNLINNAVKFTPNDGTITVRTSNDAAGRLLIEVSDTGVGIEPEHAERIFDAFEQGERTITRQFGGLGLGLAITRSLVEMHRGSISVFSAGKGKGATFRVTLTTVAERDADRGGAATPSEGNASRLRILLVDDHEDTREILLRLLRRRGHHVTAASRVDTALERLEAEPYDVLISDIGLPDGSGHELMQKARQAQPNLRGIALSGFGMEEDLRRSSNAGFLVHLTKPVDVTALQSQLDQLGARAEQ